MKSNSPNWRPYEERGGALNQKINASVSTPTAAVFLISLFVTLMAAWALDISVTGLLNGLVLTNGFRFVDPARMYHVALAVILANSIITMFIIFFITERR